jgi:hypothetical protein
VFSGATVLAQQFLLDARDVAPASRRASVAVLFFSAVLLFGISSGWAVATTLRLVTSRGSGAVAASWAGLTAVKSDNIVEGRHIVGEISEGAFVADFLVLTQSVVPGSALHTYFRPVPISKDTRYLELTGKTSVAG